MLAACAIVLLTAYGLLAARFYSGSPTVKREYVRELVAAAEAIPPNERAWVLYRDAWSMLLGASEGIPAGHRSGLLDSRPGDPDFTRAVLLLRAAGPSLDVTRLASELASLGYPGEEYVLATGEAASSPLPGSTPDKPALIDVHRPNVGRMRGLARYLDFEVRVAASQRDGARVQENVHALLAMSRQLAASEDVSEQLVGLSLAVLASRSVRDVLRDVPDLLSDAQLDTIASDLAQSPRAGRFTLDLLHERDIMGDLIQRSFTDNGRGDGRITPVGRRVVWTASGSPPGFIALGEGGISVPPLSLLTVASRRETVAEYERLMARVESQRALTPRELVHPDESVSDELDRLRSDERWCARFPLLSSSVLSSLRNGFWNSHAGTMERDATLCVIAMHKFRREHNRWPASFDELVPQYLAEVPLDVYTGKPLNFLTAREDGQPVLYSVGADLEHDGGRPDTLAEHTWPRTSPEFVAKSGDWVLWPVQDHPRE